MLLHTVVGHEQTRHARPVLTHKAYQRAKWPRGAAALQAQFARAVLSEQVAIPDIPPHHLNRPMPGLPHDGPLRRARDRRGRSVPGAEGVARVPGRIEAGACCQFLGDARHVDTAQPARLYLPMPIDRPEQRPGRHTRCFEPRLYRADRARLRVRAVRYTDLAPLPLLVYLGPP
jgi:hypothetical protein